MRYRLLAADKIWGGTPRAHARSATILCEKPRLCSIRLQIVV